MGECIGLDFGTTYSVVSRIVSESDGKVVGLEAIDFGDEENSITSMETLVVKCDGETRIGFEAVPVMRDDGASVFKGFKMLLKNDNPAELASRGYHGNDTPEAITSIFMRDLFESVRVAYPSCKDIEKIVVGVPYVWTQDGADSRKYEVVDIVQKATGARIVDFQSEPTLACAYFVHEINKKRANPFDGYILVIDYGGGTLDVTLCKSEVKSGKSEIKVIGDGWGAGENKEGEVGCAGLAFMEKVADLLLEENGVISFSKEERDYQAFVKGLELAIKKQSAHLKKCLKTESRYFSPDGAKFDTKVSGISAYYKGHEYSVKYSSLLHAYNESIRPVLAQVLADAKKEMDNLGIPYDDYSGGTFKVAMIGGFCNFALTEKQIRSDTDWLMSHHEGEDTRYTELDEVIRPKNRELAIAYGAALNANDIVGIKKQFPYTLCVYPETYKKDSHGRRVKENGRDVIVADETEEYVVFREDEEYEPGKPVFLYFESVDSAGNRVQEKIPVGGDYIPFIRRKRKNKSSSPIKQPVLEMALPRNIELYIALAMERNENLSLYVYDRTVFDLLSSEEQEQPFNKALIGSPSVFPSIDKLLGSFYPLRRDENV